LISCARHTIGFRGTAEEAQELRSRSSPLGRRPTLAEGAEIFVSLAFRRERFSSSIYGREPKSLACLLRGPSRSSNSERRSCVYGATKRAGMFRLDLEGGRSCTEYFPVPSYGRTASRSGVNVNGTCALSVPVDVLIT